MSCTRNFDSVVDAARLRDELEANDKIEKVILFAKYFKKQWIYTVHWILKKRD